MPSRLKEIKSNVMTHDFREHLYTIDKKGKRLWVYPQILKGYFRNRRVLVGWFLIAVYLSLPWIPWGDSQAVLLDIPGRRFHFFGLTLWATDTRFLVMALGALGIALFFFTAILGRIWCGWACPETVFLEFLFRPIEEFIEGGPGARRRLDLAPWDFGKITKKLIKYGIFFSLSWILATTAIAYFVGREPLLEIITHSPFENLPLFTLTVFMMGVCLFQFGWFREQFCTVLCPYARFQSVLMDSQSLTVGYDFQRGEPRGKKDGAGDCIDCGLCVRVCPTGIDIRNGIQLECIQCTACADACDSVMTKLGRKLGLVRYSTESELKGQGKKLLRPRVFVYGFILLLYAVLFCYFLVNRKQGDFQLIRPSGEAPYSILNDGSVTNRMKLHIGNKSNSKDSFYISKISDQNVKFVIPISQIEIPPGELKTVPVFFTFPKSSLINGSKKIMVELKSKNGFEGSQIITLLGPE